MSARRLTNCGTGSSNWQMRTRRRAGIEKPRRSAPAASAKAKTRWSPAIKVTQNMSQAGKSNVFPWVAADANGHVAIAWYGADQAGNSNTVSATNTHWNVFVAESVNGHAISPVFTLSQATDHSNHTGQISTGGLLGSSDRSLADFFQIGIDPNHRINIAYADNHAGPSVTYFTRQKKATPGISTKGKCAGSSH